MNKVYYSLFIIHCLLFTAVAHADDCLDYKLTPLINIITPKYEKSVIQPLRPMDLLHGDVIATMVDNYDITADITSIEDGFCVGLKSVDVTIGYTDFMIQVDSRNRPDSCTYNAIVSHEYEHINAYLSVMTDIDAELKSALENAAMDVMPIFVKDLRDIDNAINKLNDELQRAPDLILIKQKINAETEIRNKRIDQNEHGQALKQCGDF